MLTIYLLIYSEKYCMQTAKDRTTGNNKPTALYRSYN